MIYYVEDDTNIRELTMYALRQAHFEVRGFPNGSSLFEALKEETPDALLLDIMLPGMDGLEILKRLRAGAATKNLPVMMLTAKGTEYDTVMGLDAGADDYLAKPFGMMELVSRVNALLRRAKIPATLPDESNLEVGSISLSPVAHQVTVKGEAITLTLKEFDLLRALMANAGRVLSRGQLLQDVWGVSYVGETRTVDVHVQTLRQKLARADEDAAALVTTIRGLGYSLRLPQE